MYPLQVDIGPVTLSRGELRSFVCSVSKDGGPLVTSFNLYPFTYLSRRERLRDVTRSQSSDTRLIGFGLICRTLFSGLDMICTFKIVDRFLLVHFLIMVLGNFSFIFLLRILSVMLVSHPHLLYQKSQYFLLETISEAKRLQNKLLNTERKFIVTIANSV